MKTAAQAHPSDLRELKSDAAIGAELRRCFDYGLPEGESIDLTVPKMHRLRPHWHSEWMRWETERRVPNPAIMCGNG